MSNKSFLFPFDSKVP